jgi:hypothetical protein
MLRVVPCVFKKRRLYNVCSPFFVFVRSVSVQYFVLELVGLQQYALGLRDNILLKWWC